MEHTRPRYWIPVVLLLVLIGTPSVTRGGFSSADAKEAGFTWKGRKGEDLSNTFSDNLCTAINALDAISEETVEGIDEIVKCARRVKAKDHFCTERGSAEARSAAKTLPDSDASEAEGDRVNIQRKYLDSKPDANGRHNSTFIYFCAIIAHEMVHTKQDPTGLGSGGVTPEVLSEIEKPGLRALRGL